MGTWAPGLAPPVQKHLHSEENEGFFSYDGVWRNGRPNGLGKYLFMDKATYEGDFKNGIPHGEGVAVYPRNKEGAGVYAGWWKDGRYEGKGTFTYASGAVEVGCSEAGAPVGQGVKWSADRTKAWKLQDGEYYPWSRISLGKAAKIAARIGLPPP